MVTERSDYHVRAISRALTIFDTFLDVRGRALGVGEIAVKIGLPKATVHRMLITLVDGGYLERDLHTEKYRLGLRLFQLGYLVQSRAELRMEARPYLERLGQETQESVYLSLLVGIHRVVIDKVESPLPIRHDITLGESLPVHVGASGKALLAFLAPERLDSILGRLRLEQVTPNTITDPEVLRRELAEVRRRGYAFSSDERFVGSSSVAAPILGVTGEVVASLGVVGPSVRLDPAKTVKVIELIIRYAGDISRRMGYLAPALEAGQ
ncbi:MAG: IclR family transcriptional regulator [Bacteroidota bacterium]